MHKVLELVERECDRARDRVAVADGCMGIAQYEVRKVIRAERGDAGDLTAVEQKVTAALEAVKAFHLAIHAVQDAVDATR